MKSGSYQKFNSGFGVTAGGSVIMFVSSFAILVILTSFSSAFEPNWNSLDSRKKPAWFDEAKVGVMVHFGLYSTIIGSEWFWSEWRRGMPELVEFVKMTKPPNFAYQDLVHDFKAELFDADEWAKIFEDAGAQYVVLTAKHHDGFALYPSSYSFNWNSFDVGPHIDFLLELSDAVRSRESSMKFGIYYSLMEWFHPLYLRDKNQSKVEFVTQKVMPELKEIVQNYEPDIVWADGDWEMNEDYWQSKEFLAWLFTNSSTRDSVVVNDRWGKGVMCKHGTFVSCRDRFNPGVIQKLKFENVLSLDRTSWGYDPMTRLENIISPKELIRELVTTVACNGNMLINVGPNRDGRIDNIYVERLQQLGMWLKTNGEGIYATRPWIRQNQGTDIWFTTKGSGELFVFILEYPFYNNSVALQNFAGIIGDGLKVSFLGYSGVVNVIDCSLAVNSKVLV